MKDLSIYIHIPFCKSRCMYCAFLTFAGKNECAPQYVKSLCEEIARRSADFRDYRVETVYFGGGTPSLIRAELIKKIIQQIKAKFKVKRTAEVSMECNPESVELSKLKIYKEAGVNRFSIGIQSFKNETLRKIARPHDDKKIFIALENFKKSGIKNFGADFIMGLPFQTLASFKNDVETILKFRPTHLSFYFLSYDTPKIDAFIKDCPSEEEQIKMYTWLCKRLKKADFEHYEVSNWAKKGAQCRHNRRYWEQKDYLGVGLGAHSIVGDKIWENQKDLAGYLRDPIKTENHMTIDAELKQMEYIMLRLRTSEGMNLKTYATLGGDVTELLKNAAPYIKTGELKKRANNLFATEKGFLISERMTEKLI